MTYIICAVTCCQDNGFAAAHKAFWDDLAGALVHDKVDILCGDFNMALWRVIPELSARGLQVSMLAFYPWACTRGGGATIAEGPDETNPEEARPTCHDEIRYDSLGIFALAPCCGIDRAYDQEDLQDPDRLDKYQTGQGYSVNSYLGKQDSMEESLQSIHVGGDPQHQYPRCTQKKINVEMWDPAHLLWTRGGHMPLLVYVGEKPYRRNASLSRREGGHIRRDWGPSSRNRIELMRRTAERAEQGTSYQTAGATDPTPAAPAASSTATQEPASWESASWDWTSHRGTGNASSSGGWWPR